MFKYALPFCLFGFRCPLQTVSRSLLVMTTCSTMTTHDQIYIPFDKGLNWEDFIFHFIMS